MVERNKTKFNLYPCKESDENYGSGEEEESNEEEVSDLQRKMMRGGKNSQRKPRSHDEIKEKIMDLTKRKSLARKKSRGESDKKEITWIEIKRKSCGE